MDGEKPGAASNSPSADLRALPRVFIDGQAGSSGLEVAARLSGRSDIELVVVAPERRKDANARAACMADADIAILCLPDEQAREAVDLANKTDIRLIDASSAHRVAPGWVYGFAEYDTEQRRKIASAARIANPGCYATGAISLLAPLLRAGLIPADWPLAVHGVSGYSGGGRSLIAEYEGAGTSFHLYGLDLQHKHLPEIIRYGGLRSAPVFFPSVGAFRQGMIVSIPLHPRALPGTIGRSDLLETLRTAYAGETLVQVMDSTRHSERLFPSELAGSDVMRLRVFGDDDRALLCAQLDNLGKGAAGAAVQNLNLALGLPETRGLAGFSGSKAML